MRIVRQQVVVWLIVMALVLIFVIGLLFWVNGYHVTTSGTAWGLRVGMTKDDALNFICERAKEADIHTDQEMPGVHRRVNICDLTVRERFKKSNTWIWYRGRTLTSQVLQFNNDRLETIGTQIEIFEVP